MQIEYDGIIWSYPLPEIDYTQFPQDSIVYGLGGCTGGLVISPAPICVPIATNVPPVTDYPEIQDVPVNSVPVPGTIMLLVIGLLMLKRFSS